MRRRRASTSSTTSVRHSSLRDAGRAHAAGWLYAVTSVLLGAVFLWAVVLLHREQTEAAAFRAIHASNASFERS